MPFPCPYLLFYRRKHCTVENEQILVSLLCLCNQVRFSKSQFSYYNGHDICFFQLNVKISYGTYSTLKGIRHMLLHFTTTLSKGEAEPDAFAFLLPPHSPPLWPLLTLPTFICPFKFHHWPSSCQVQCSFLNYYFPWLL